MLVPESLSSMIYFLLPRLSFNTYQNIDYSQHTDSVQISNSLSYYLYDIKSCINDHSQSWDTYKKLTNPYEFIHTNIHQKKKCIAKYKPISRSFFKMIEIALGFNLCPESSTPIQSFHLAEGPGGFIEAILHLRNNKNDKYHGMTILSDTNDLNIPAWKKTMNFLKENPNVHIETGADQTGDLLSFDNFVYCSEKYKSSMDIITGDGGFDFSQDFNNQENNISNLLFAQVAFALTMQKYKGAFVLKIFDSFMQSTIDILAILSSFYTNVYITKPQTSRYANSEKYIVCCGFIYESSDVFLPRLMDAFKKMAETINKKTEINKQFNRYLNLAIPQFFLTKLEEYNSIFGQQQIENIHYTLSIITKRFKSDKIENLIKINVQKCIQWCIKHNIFYNIIPQNLNIFLSNELSDFAFDTKPVDQKHSCFIR